MDPCDINFIYYLTIIHYKSPLILNQKKYSSRSTQYIIYCLQPIIIYLKTERTSNFLFQKQNTTTPTLKLLLL
jgi:hypothetical protein